MGSCWFETDVLQEVPGMLVSVLHIIVMCSSILHTLNRTLVNRTVRKWVGCEALISTHTR